MIHLIAKIDKQSLIINLMYFITILLTIFNNSNFLSESGGRHCTGLISGVHFDQKENYEVHQYNHKELFINLGLPGESFRQKVHFMVQMASGNHPGGVPLIQTKIQKLLKQIGRISMKCINVIISLFINLELLGGSFWKKSTFWSKLTPEISLVTSP